MRGHRREVRWRADPWAWGVREPGGGPRKHGAGHRRDFSWGAVPGGPRGCAQRAGGCQQGEVEGIERKGKREKESKKRTKKKKKGKKKKNKEKSARNSERPEPSGKSRI